MISLFANRTYAALFAAQVVALLGAGLLTVALGLLAFDLAPEQAGLVLGGAYTIKMVAYVGLSPIAQAIAQKLPRKLVLIGADLVRAGVALCLPFVHEVWQVYVLIFVLQTASATFTPAYQAVLPDVLPKEQDYTRALSLSRLAYDLENMLSPALAGLLLLLVSYSNLFLGTCVGFLASALLIWRAALPQRTPQTERGFWDRVTRGIRLYLATPRLRGLLALNFGAAAVSAFVLVNTVVLVRGELALGEASLALIMAAFGFGSMVVALSLPRLLEQVGDRIVMFTGAACLLVSSLAAAAWMVVSGLSFVWAMVVWAILGASYSATLTPSGRLIRRSGSGEDLPALFAAQFALSHACWLVTYPLAGWVGARFGLAPALLLLAGLGVVFWWVARRVWTTPD